MARSLKWYEWGAIGLGAATLLVGGREVVIMVRRGARLGPKTAADLKLIIPQSPSALAAAAGLDLNSYALARAISSEHGRDSAAVKTAIGWAIRNEATRNGRSVFEQLTGGGKAGPAAGKFSAQALKGVYTKYASTRLDPYEQEGQIAKGVITGQLRDPTKGATNFFSPKAQRASHAKDPANKTPEAVDAKWRAGGLRPVVVAQVDPDLVTFYRAA